ncbi:hypothetical protein GCM10027275_21170 [Rhabdobacter roseus]|uniref:Uncharacterized protein n=1 Tax=Rhabdobacter roseus TaxID=1655419 RepID=A0A840TKM9_9BACT|nr:hypothetical protein [Rhabdobacter roseus]MBB5284051.1 hypothetical protein [Rhabdobacter roseus]
MEIRCIDNKTFELLDSSGNLGYIIYDGLLSSKATILVGEDNYKIIPLGILSTSISVTKNGAEISTLEMNWKGNITILFENGQKFIVKATGSFRDKFVLEDEDQQQILLLNPDFNWITFNYNYSVLYDNKSQDLLLILLATYAANYYTAAMASVL